MSLPDARGVNDGPGVAVPSSDEKAPSLLEIRHLVQTFAVRGPGATRGERVSALADVSLTLKQGETVAVVGETGSGKTTLANAVIGEPPAESGEILLGGRDINRLRGHEARRARASVQMVFQDPFSALNPRWSVERIVGEPLVVHRIGSRSERRGKVEAVMRQVGLNPDRYRHRYPRDLSGGECQRVAIARALVISPKLVICDEPVTSLDVSIQAQILDLLSQLRDELGLSLLLIAHDLAVVETLSDHVATMYLGKLCEVGPTDDVFPRPRHPYTAALLSAVPPRPGFKLPDERIELSGDIPSPVNPPSGCRFRTRCPRAQEKCAAIEPQATQVGDDHVVMCHFPLGA